ncbi:MAG: hypothetical protein ACP5O1_12975, partial [Phycisphaerae bacterium]
YFLPPHYPHPGPFGLALERAAACVIFWPLAMLVGYSACTGLAEMLIPPAAGEEPADRETGVGQCPGLGSVASLATIVGFLIVFWPSIADFFVHVFRSV